VFALHIKRTRSIWQRFGLRLTFPIVSIYGNDPTAPSSETTSVPLTPLTPFWSSCDNLDRRSGTFKANMLVNPVLVLVLSKWTLTVRAGRQSHFRRYEFAIEIGLIIGCG